MDRTFNSVNTLKPIRLLTYNIAKFLIENNDEIWKLLQYATSDALSQNNLTKEEKRNLIYNGEEDETGYRFFFQPYTDDADELRQTRLYMYILKIIPDENQYATVMLGIDIVCHNKLLTLDTYENRTDVLLQQLVEYLNGRNFLGIDNMSFNRKNGNFVQTIKFDEKFYSGKRLLISCRVSSLN